MNWKLLCWLNARFLNKAMAFPNFEKLAAEGFPKRAEKSQLELAVEKFIFELGKLEEENPKEADASFALWSNVTTGAEFLLITACIQQEIVRYS